MRIEHAAWQVHDPHAVAAWYCQHLGFTVKRRFDAPVPCNFLADSTGRVMIEVYHNPAAAVLDYASLNPLQLHLAFVSDDIDADRDRLLAAGASLVEQLTTPTGDQVVMLRDPWHFCIQLCKRAAPMV